MDMQPQAVLARLAELRALDAPTHGGRVLSYVYDSGLPELDELVERAATSVLHLNGLDPIVFGSIAVLERELGAFVAPLLHAPEDAAVTVTSGGTESILLATLAARTVRPGRTVLLAPTTRHPAWAKAAHIMGLQLQTVPVAADGVVDAEAFAAALSDDVALAVVSAPSYPFGAVDPVAAVADACQARDVDLHVDACIGGLALPFVAGVPAWDFRVPGVTSISADLHKYAYAPKGASVLLQRDQARQHAVMFADTSWPGYPVVTSTLLGSRQSAGVAGAWAVVSALGTSGLRERMDVAMRCTKRLLATITSIDGLRIVGAPVGPLFAVAADREADHPIDPTVLVDRLRAHGFVAQAQPGLQQANGPDLPVTLHCTVTPALAQHLDACCAAFEAAASEARMGHEPGPLGQLAAKIRESGTVPNASLEALLGNADARALTASSADLIALMEALPDAVVSRLMRQVLAAHLKS